MILAERFSMIFAKRSLNDPRGAIFNDLRGAIFNDPREAIKYGFISSPKAII
jgi:hypothetical protein